MSDAIPRGILVPSARLAPFTTWEVGGAAKQLYKPTGIEDLSRFLKQLPPDEALLCLGLGSNVLIRDSGFDGTVVVTVNGLKTVTLLEGNLLRAEAGLSCPSLARFSARCALTGLEFLAGVPGTVGGALRMNAGAFGGETWEHVVLVETMDRQGNIHYRRPDEYQVTYRHVSGHDHEWFVAGHFQLQPGNKEKSFEWIREWLNRRAETQPTGQPSCGSVFKNPPGDFAARLIEAAGLKNFRIGHAVISPKHANFIINEGQATAEEIEQVIDHAAACVAQQFGIQLTREVHIIGKSSLSTS